MSIKSLKILFRVCFYETSNPEYYKLVDLTILVESSRVNEIDDRRDVANFWPFAHACESFEEVASSSALRLAQSRISTK